MTSKYYMGKFTWEGITYDFNTSAYDEKGAFSILTRKTARQVKKRPDPVREYFVKNKDKYSITCREEI